MIDQTMVVTVAGNTIYGDVTMDLRKYHAGAIQLPSTHTGGIGFVVGGFHALDMSNIGVDNSLNLLTVNHMMGSINMYPLPSPLFSNSYAMIYQSGPITPTNPLTYYITLKE